MFHQLQLGCELVSEKDIWRGRSFTLAEVWAVWGQLRVSG